LPQLVDVRHLPAVKSKRRALSAREKLLTAVIVLHLAIQVTVPVWQLSAPRPARFGWQMYSALNMPRQYVVVKADGTSSVVDLGRYVAQLRAELDLRDILPRAVCARDPDAVEVTFRVLPELVDRSYRCPQ
jgi:hypothetical protein